ncbi:MAG: hypothetical protein NWF11_08275, partial [Candidatus Bathyarchaeota archaeon]|nr:hypothetical protein [Candidatus Bathyarchaeota archaeon]
LWQKETVESGIKPRHTSIVVDSDDNPHISYFDDTNYRLKYAGVVGKVYDFAIVGADLFKTIVGHGYNVMVNSTFLNQGSEIETFNVTVYANETFATSRSFSLEPGEPTTAHLIWSSDVVMKGNFIIEATIATHPCESDIGDNSFIAGWLLVTISGDVDGDKDVDIFDIVKIAGVYGLSQPDPSYDANSDIDGDGDIDIFDIVAAASHYGESW